MFYRIVARRIHTTVRSDCGQYTAPGAALEAAKELAKDNRYFSVAIVVGTGAGSTQRLYETLGVSAFEAQYGLCL